MEFPLKCQLVYNDILDVVVFDFMGNRNYEEIVQTLLTRFRALGAM